MLQLVLFVVECGIARFLCPIGVFDIGASSWLATFVPNLVSFAAYIAELAHGEKSRIQSLTQLI